MINFTSYRDEEDIKFSMCSLGFKESEQSEGIKAIFNPYIFVPVNVILSLTSLTDREHPDSHRSSESFLSSFLVETSVSLSIMHGSLCWAFLATHICNLSNGDC